jgi:hypothetical protein
MQAQPAASLYVGACYRKVDVRMKLLCLSLYILNFTRNSAVILQGYYNIDVLIHGFSACDLFSLLFN